MRIIDVEDYMTMDTDSYKYIEKVYYMYPHETEVILKACKNNVNKLKEWFNIIQIKYDKLEIWENRMVIYYVDGMKLSLQDLSSGEQTLLYMLAYKELKEPILVYALLERLGKRLAKVVVEQFRDYDLVIVLIGSGLQECMVPFYDRG